MGNRQVAMVGLGGMGAGIGHRLVEAGFTVVVYNRTPEKADPLVAAGARRAPTPAGAAATADVIVLSLSDEAAVDEVLFGSIGESLRPGTVVIDTSTVSPSYAREAAERIAAAGGRRVEACVIGNPMMAREGELRVFAAGDKRDVDSVRDVLEAFSKLDLTYLGAAGQASVMKLAFNLLLGAQTAALAEAVGFAESLGIDREQLLTALMRSGWRSPVLNFRAEFMRSGRYEPAGFRARLMAKDLRLAVEEAATRQLALPVTESAARQFAQTVTAGAGDLDASAVLETLRTQS